MTRLWSKCITFHYARQISSEDLVYSIVSVANNILYLKVAKRAEVMLNVFNHKNYNYNKGVEENFEKLCLWL